MSVNQFVTPCSPHENIVMETRGREAFVIGRSKVDLKKMLNVLISKRARVPQMEIEDTVRMERPGAA